MKMHSTIKSESRTSVEMPVEMMMPHIMLDEEQLPELTNWKVGEEYYLLLKVKKSSSHVDHENKICATFDVLEAGAYEYNE